MSNPALAALDDKIFSALSRVGFADTGIYTSGKNSLSCRAIIERDVQILGEIGEVVGYRTTAAFVLADFSIAGFGPARGDSLQVGSEVWTLEKMIHQDESRSEWIVNSGQ